MAPGLDNLVDRLLHDVALTGSHGLGLVELARTVKAHYKPSSSPDKQQETEHIDLLLSDAPPLEKPVVDVAFVDSIWDWLAKQPDIEVQVDHAIDTAVASGELLAALNLGASHADSSSARTSRHARERLFASKDRMWHAITGHGVDYKRISALEFECLSVIASHGPTGALQPTVRRLTGQDKRSVPKRTDTLAERGYITKRNVVAAGATTSLLTLKRYDDLSRNDATTGLSLDGSDIVSSETWYHTSMQLLKQQPQQVMALQDLRIELGIHTRNKLRETKLLMRCIKRLTESGCIRRCTAMSHNVTGDRRSATGVRCIQLLREPTALDQVLWMRKTTGRKNYARAKHQAGEDISLDAGAAGATADADADNAAGSEEDDDDEAAADLDKLEFRPVPQWTPDTTHVNLLYDIIDQAGLQGISAMALCERSMGPRWRRPLDDLMAKLTETWQYSQPPHLRHLGIVKTSGAQRTYYHYRTYENFEKAVTLGQVTWEAATEIVKPHGLPSAMSKKRFRTPANAQQAVADLDKWGFPKHNSALFAGDQGQASLAECAGIYNGSIALDGDRSTPVRRGRKPKVRKLGVDSEAGLTTPLSGSRKNQRATSVDSSLMQAAEPSTYTSDSLMLKVKRKVSTPKSLLKSRDSGTESEKAFEDWVQMTAKRLMRSAQRKEQPDQDQSTTKRSRIGVDDGADDAQPSPKRQRKLPEREAGDEEHSTFDVSDTAMAISNNAGTRTNESLRPATEAANSSSAEDAMDYSSLNSLQMLKSLLLNRQRQGIYINPPGALDLKAKSHVRKPGRPKKVVIAVIKTDRLKELPWFQHRKLVSPVGPTIVEAEGVQHFAGADAQAEDVSPVETLEDMAVVDDDDMSEPVRSDTDDELLLDKDGNFVPHRARPPSSSEQGMGGRARIDVEREPSSVGHSSNALPENFSEGPGNGSQVIDMVMTGSNSAIEADRGVTEQDNQPDSTNSVASPGSSTSPPVLCHGRSSGLAVRSPVKEAIPAPLLSGKVVANESPHIAISSNQHGADRSATSAAPWQTFTKAYVESHPEEMFHHVGNGRYKPGAKAKKQRPSITKHVLPGNDVAQTSNVSEPSKDGQKTTKHDAQSTRSEKILLADEAVARQNSRTEPLLGTPTPARPLIPALSVVRPYYTARQNVVEAAADTTRSPSLSRLVINSEIPLDTSTAVVPSITEAEQGTRSRPAVTLQMQESSSMDVIITDMHDLPKVTAKPKKVGTADDREKAPYRTGAKKIVVDTVTQCGGVYPGKSEMWYPFATAWKELYDVEPQRAVLHRSIKSALDSGSLRRIIFVFQDEKGIKVEGKLLMLPEISATSPLVDTMKQAVIKAHPLQHIPEEAEISEEVRKGARMVDRADMGKNAAERPKPEPKPMLDVENIELESTRFMDQRFPVIDGLLVQRTQAAVQLAREDHRVLGFGRSQPVRRSYSKAADTPTTIADIRSGRYVPPGTIMDRGVGRLLSISRLNDTGAAMRRPMRPVIPSKRPVGLGYLPSQFAHSLLDPAFVASSIQAVQQVERKKPGPKPKFPRALAAKLAQSGARMLMDMYGVYHATSGTFGTFIMTEPDRAPLSRLRPRTSRKRSFHYDEEMRLDEEQTTPQNPSHILKRSKTLSHPAAGQSGMADYQVPQENDRVHEWDQDIVNDSGSLAGGQRWTFVHHEIDQDIVQPRGDSQDRVAMAGSTPQLPPASNPHLALSNSRQWHKSGADASPVAPSTAAPSTRHYKLKTADSAPPRNLLHDEQGPAYSEAPSFDKAYVLKHSGEQFHHVGHGRYKRGPKPIRARQLDGWSPVQPDIVRYHTPSARGSDAQIAASSPSPSLASQQTPIPTKRPLKPLKRKAATRDLADESDGEYTLENGTGKHPPMKKRKTRVFGRDRRTAASFSDEDALVRTMAMVGLLCGGISQVGFSWGLVAHAMNFKYEGEFLRHRWQKYRDRREGDVKRMQDAIREPFLRDYERGRLPSIDFSKPSDIDWTSLMKWAGEQLRSDDDGLDEALKGLPTTRKELLTRTDIKPSELSELDANEFFTSTTDTYLKVVAHKLLQGSVLPGEARPGGMGNPEDGLILIKSWCRAVTLTPIETYDDAAAANRLKMFPADLLKRAISELVEAQIFSQAKKGRQLPGRNFHLSGSTLKTFSRWPDEDATYLRDVADAWRTICDQIQTHDKLVLSMHTKDTEMVVLGNLIAQGYVKVTSTLPERNDPFDAPFPKLSAWGYTDGNYNAKWVDKSRLTFPIVYERTAMWTDHHNLQQVPIPMHPAPVPGESAPRIPFWVDIHDKLIPHIWEMMLRSILNLIVFRPGITGPAIEQAHKGKIWVWEIEMMMGWMEQTGLSKRVGAGREENGVWKGGWCADDWWYCAFAPDISDWKTYDEVVDPAL